MPVTPHQPGWFRKLSEEDRINIYESRLTDLETIQNISFLMLVPLVLLSFAGGYVMADRMLRPLKAVNNKMRTITSRDLTETISYVDSDDEMSELIRNFNSMILRLKANFDSQKQFVENASHELKTPLAVVQTNLAAALEGKYITSKEATNLIDTAVRSTHFMNKLIEDLLLLSTLEQAVPRESLNIVENVRQALSQTRDLAKFNKVTFKETYSKQEIHVFANAVLLQRAVMNIVENAVKYSPPSTTVEVVVSLTKNKKNVTVSVTDDGPGIPPDKQSRIFQRFYRIDRSRSRKTGGTGLGLSIAQEVITLFQGTITVTSAQNKKSGSTFIITLPVEHGGGLLKGMLSKKNS